MDHCDGVRHVGRDGRWQVTTETATYVLDLDNKRCVRVPDAGLGLPGLPPAEVAVLRKDHASVPLISVECARVGQPLVVVIDVRGDGILTVRRTTIVRQVRRLPEAHKRDFSS